MHHCAAFVSGRLYARSMSSQTLARPRRASTSNRKKKKAQKPGWLSWWPLLAGIVITLVAVKTAEILPLMGPDGLFRLKLLYPFALLLKQPQLGLAEQTSDSWSQMMLYAQWVIYGLYASLAMRWKPVWSVLMQVVVVHLLGFGLLWLLSAK
jgi:hypothetical protein